MRAFGACRSTLLIQVFGAGAESMWEKSYLSHLRKQWEPICINIDEGYRGVKCTSRLSHVNVRILWTGGCDRCARVVDLIWTICSVCGSGYVQLTSRSILDEQTTFI